MAASASASGSGSAGIYGVIVLLLTMGCSFGNYFCYDNPAALMPSFLSELCADDMARYLLLYSVYSIPNMIQPFVGGYIVDQVLGLRRAPALFCAFIVIGSGLVALAAAMVPRFGGSVAFHVALLGRFIFGLGGECNQVSVNAIIAKWFKGRQLSTVYALSLCFSRCGSAANFALMPILLDVFGFVPALFATFVICLLSFGAALLIWLVDSKGEAKGIVKPTAPSGSMSFRDLKQVLELRQVLVYLMCPFFYICIQSFISLAPAYFKVVWSLSQREATRLCAIPFVISAMLSPIFGLFADRLGRPLLFIVASNVGITVVHVLACVGLISPWFIVCGLGLLFSACAATLWPMVALIVPTEHLGTSYGIMTAFQNTGLALAPLFIAAVRSSFSGGDDVRAVLLAQRVFAASAICSLACSVLLLLTENSDSPLLMGPTHLASKHRRLVSMTQSPINGWISAPLAVIRSSALLMSPSQLVSRLRSPNGPPSPAVKPNEADPLEDDLQVVVNLTSPLLGNPNTR